MGMSSVDGRPKERLLPELTWESRAFWTGGFDGKLLICHCDACERFFHPPASACWRCRSTEVGPRAVSGRARVAAFSINIHQWLPGFPPPYVVAIVEIIEQPDVRLTTNIMRRSPEEVYIGMPVEGL